MKKLHQQGLVQQQLLPRLGQSGVGGRDLGEAQIVQRRVAAPEPQGEMTHRVEGYSNTTPAHAVQLYKHAAPLFARDGNARMIARPELDS